ncbi:hypothetical protein EQV77_07025 [Halobacillus fulvus]|nr:hypothetical protein EQV77_07025 [Halobacillus fulvus]
MGSKEWIGGLATGLLAGIVIQKCKEETPIYKMKYERKRANLYMDGQQAYDRIQAARARLAATAIENQKERSTNHDTANSETEERQ